MITAVGGEQRVPQLWSFWSFLEKDKVIKTGHGCTFALVFIPLKVLCNSFESKETAAVGLETGLEDFEAY
eukprot:scaffold7337_cov131-Cylindrotheca_fusiformis.AAC.6